MYGPVQHLNFHRQISFIHFHRRAEPQGPRGSESDFPAAKINAKASPLQHVQTDKSIDSGRAFAQITQIVQHHRQKRYSYWPKLKIWDIRQLLCDHMIEIDN